MNKRTFAFQRDDVIQLHVWSPGEASTGWEYPMTFTIRECIEEWCASHGGYLIYINYSTPGLDTLYCGGGLFKFVSTVLTTNVHDSGMS